ncbi:hypothetical protein KM92DES2_10624 [uncultured Desulfovibrio sp.]|uniref:Uncharacterized protein n=1 Tax=uncultured Desulfovibrio sp. TaxID=167968 RepID=A0A212J6U4_9BACT|nr:hypothetical protein [uncultured Desulfovibrio sp.]SBV95153.1 hypothetical protein KM92DES2_10624 [uncultured Desulfovibrio sp.]
MQENFFCGLSERELIIFFRGIHSSRDLYKNLIFHMILSEFEFAVIQQNATGLNKISRIFDDASHELFCNYITSKDFPFCLTKKIRFNYKKAFSIIKEKKKNDNTDVIPPSTPLVEHQVELLREYGVKKMVREPLDIKKFKIVLGMKKKVLEKTSQRNEVGDKIIEKYGTESAVGVGNFKKVRVCGAPDGPSVDFEYGPQGIPSSKNIRYKRRY